MAANLRLACEDARRGPHTRIRRRAGGRAGDADLRGRAGRRRAPIRASSSTPTSSSSPSRACAGRCGSRATGSSSPCPRSTTGSSRRAPCSSSTTRARCAGRPTPTRRRSPTSTRTSRRALDVAGASAARRSAPPGTARAGTSRSARRSTPRVRGTVCWYPTGLHDGKLGKEPTDSLARAGEIGGELLLIFGTRDPHTPPPGRETVRAGAGGAGTRFTLARVRRRARLRARHRPALRPRGHRPGLRRDRRVLPADAVILYDHPASANCLKVRILLRAAGRRRTSA